MNEKEKQWFEKTLEEAKKLQDYIIPIEKLQELASPLPPLEECARVRLARENPGSLIMMVCNCKNCSVWC